MESLERLEEYAVEVLEYYQERFTHFEKGEIALSLVRRWRNAFCDGTVDINETMNFCRDAEMFKNDYDLIFHGFYNSTREINHNLWEEFLKNSLT